MKIREFVRGMTRPRMGRRLVSLLLSVEMMGVCVAVFDRIALGTDPFSTMNLGLSRLTGLSFGTWQLTLNALLMLIVLRFDVGRIGAGTLGQVPYTVLIYLAVIVVSYLMVERSRWGISVYMVGGNEKATRFSGIDTKKTLMGVYIFSAVLSGAAGILMTSRYNSARADYVSSYTMQAVAATVLGGTSINGGSGHVLGTVIAVAIIQVVSSGFNILKINRNFTDIATGLILVGVLAVNHFVGLEKKTKRK